MLNANADWLNSRVVISDCGLRIADCGFFAGDHFRPNILSEWEAAGEGVKDAPRVIAMRLRFPVIARSVSDDAIRSEGRHERSEVISLLIGIASPPYSGLATASPDCFASLAMTKTQTF